MSSAIAKAYQRLASLLAGAPYGGTSEAPSPAGMPEPGSLWAHRPPPQFPMPWASEWGEDVFGLWCGLRVGEITQRLRWIPPGQFWMGSEESEPERDDDETRHRVTLTQGYWLAETACTQGLWREVMGDDRSRFKGVDLPVEQVDWQQAQEFCGKLNERLPGLAVRLPSEAEWEYACRAGTQGPFWWGADLTTELANYNGQLPYNNGPKGEYRERTLAVKSFEPNPWGLYQVHGNVWEWCEDWYGEYPSDDVVDPAGPERGSLRVMRGCSWLNDGRGLRAAYRRRYAQSDERYNYLGFRLAAGPLRAWLSSEQMR